MRKLPARIIRILKDAPRRCPKRANVMGMVQWRLERGLTFTSLELVHAAKKRTTKRFVESVLDTLVLQCVILRRPNKSYAANESNHQAIEASVVKFAADHPNFTRRDIWLNLTTSMNERNLDRMLSRLLNSGMLCKTHRGRYSLGRLYEFGQSEALNLAQSKTENKSQKDSVSSQDRPHYDSKSGAKSRVKSEPKRLKAAPMISSDPDVEKFSRAA